jgi:hypothetical protein
LLTRTGGKKQVNVVTNIWGFLSAAFMGALSITFLEQETKNDCEKNLNKFFLGVGITELICAALYMYLIIVFLVTKADAARAKSLMGGPSLCLCYGGITLLVFLILGSIWVWSSDGDECVRFLSSVVHSMIVLGDSPSHLFCRLTRRVLANSSPFLAP